MKALALALAVFTTATHSTEQLTVQAEDGSWTLNPATFRLYLNKAQELQLDMEARYVNAPKRIDEVMRYAVTGCKQGNGKLGIVNHAGEFSATVHQWTTADIKVADELAMKLCASAAEEVSK